MKLKGHFAVFNQFTEIDSHFEGHFMERIAPGAFRKTFSEDRDRMRVLFQHGQDPHAGSKPLGAIDVLREDAVGAYYEAPLFEANYVSELLPGLEAGQYGASFRFRTLREEFAERPTASKHNPTRLPERTIQEARVFEFGPVTFPAYSEATAGVRSSDVRLGAHLGGRLSFGDWADTWLEEGKSRRAWKPATVLVYSNVLKHLRETFGSVRLDSIRPRDVSAYRDQALGDFSPKFVGLHLNVLHDVFRSAIADELVQVNPVSGIERPRVPRQRWRILEPHEVPRVRKAFSNDRARRVFLTLALTGLRRSELVGLRWRHINLVEGALRVVESKSEEGERLIALPASLVDELAKQFTASPFRSDEDYVFAHPERGSKLEAHWYHKEFQAALKAAGVEGHVRTFHDMRHTAITNLAATGASPIAVMATAGHRSMKTTAAYLHLAGVVFRDEASALERRLLGVQDPGTNDPEHASLSQEG